MEQLVEVEYRSLEYIPLKSVDMRPSSSVLGRFMAMVPVLE